MILMNALRAGQTTDYSESDPDTMYVLYSALIVAFFAVMSPSLVYQAVRYRKYIGSLSQRLGYLPVSFNIDGDESGFMRSRSAKC